MHSNNNTEKNSSQTNSKEINLNSQPTGGRGEAHGGGGFNPISQKRRKGLLLKKNPRKRNVDGAIVLLMQLLSSTTLSLSVSRYIGFSRANFTPAIITLLTLAQSKAFDTVEDEAYDKGQLLQTPPYIAALLLNAASVSLFMKKPLMINKRLPFFATVNNRFLSKVKYRVTLTSISLFASAAMASSLVLKFGILLDSRGALRVAKILKSLEESVIGKESEEDGIFLIALKALTAFDDYDILVGLELALNSKRERAEYIMKMDNLFANIKTQPGEVLAMLSSDIALLATNPEIEEKYPKGTIGLYKSILLELLNKPQYDFLSLAQAKQASVPDKYSLFRRERISKHHKGRFPIPHQIAEFSDQVLSKLLANSAKNILQLEGEERAIYCKSLFAGLLLEEDSLFSLALNNINKNDYTDEKWERFFYLLKLYIDLSAPEEAKALSEWLNQTQNNRGNESVYISGSRLAPSASKIALDYRNMLDFLMDNPKYISFAGHSVIDKLEFRTFSRSSPFSGASKMSSINDGNPIDNLFSSMYLLHLKYQKLNTGKQGENPLYQGAIAEKKEIENNIAKLKILFGNCNKQASRNYFVSSITHMPLIRHILEIDRDGRYGYTEAVNNMTNEILKEIKEDPATVAQNNKIMNFLFGEGKGELGYFGYLIKHDPIKLAQPDSDIMASIIDFIKYIDKKGSSIGNAAPAGKIQNFLSSLTRHSAYNLALLNKGVDEDKRKKAGARYLACTLLMNKTLNTIQNLKNGPDILESFSGINDNVADTYYAFYELSALAPQSRLAKLLEFISTSQTADAGLLDFYAGRSVLFRKAVGSNDFLKSLVPGPIANNFINNILNETGLLLHAEEVQLQQYIVNSSSLEKLGAADGGDELGLTIIKKYKSNEKRSFTDTEEEGLGGLQERLNIQLGASDEQELEIESQTSDLQLSATSNMGAQQRQLLELSYINTDQLKEVDEALLKEKEERKK